MVGRGFDNATSNMASAMTAGLTSVLEIVTASGEKERGEAKAAFTESEKHPSRWRKRSERFAGSL
jgi:hypothetical protein